MKQFILKEFNSNIVTHIKTSWELSDTPSFSNIIQNVYESTVYKNTWFVDISQLPGTVLYIRAKRHFDNGEDSDWIPFEEVLSSVADINYAISEHAIEMPMLKNELFIKENLDIIAIDLSNPDFDGVAHIATNYIIKNLNDEIVYKSLFNTSDLLYHEVDINNYNISPYEQLKLFVSFISEHNVQSQFLEVDIIPDEVKVYPIYSLENIIYNLDYDLKLSNTDNLYYDLTILDIEKSNILYERLNVNNTILTIPQYTVFPNKTYKIEIKKHGEDIIYYSNVFTIQDINSIYKINSNDFITPVFEEIDKYIPTDINNYYLKGLGNNVIITYNKSDNKYLLNTLTKTTLKTFNTYLESSIEFSNEFINIQPIGGNKAVVISKHSNDSNKLIFTILSYTTNTFLLNEYRQDVSDILFDLNKISITSFVFNGYDRSIYFLGIKNNKVNVFKYLLETGEFKEVIELYNQEFNKYFIIPFDIDRFYISATGLDNDDFNSPIYLYNIKKEELIIETSLDNEFKNSNLEVISSRTGNNIIFDINDTTNKELVFNIDNNIFTMLNEDSTMNNMDKRIIQLENYATFIGSSLDTYKFKYTELI